MLKCVFVPNSVLVEDKTLFALLVSEHHFVIEHIDIPHEWHGY
jgi:hypothetical protein